MLIWADHPDNILPLNTVGPGGLISLPAALNGDYSVTARAVEDCKLGLIPANTILHVLGCDTRLMQAAMKFLALEVARKRGLFARSDVELLANRERIHEVRQVPDVSKRLEGEAGPRE